MRSIEGLIWRPGAPRSACAILLLPGTLALTILAVIIAGGQALAERPASQAQSAAVVSPAQQAAVAQIAAQAQGALRQADYEGAIRGFEKLIQMAPRVAEFHANLGMAYYSSGRFADAGHRLREALRLKPALENAQYFLGLSLAASGQCQEALPYLRKNYGRILDRQLKRLVGLEALKCSMALDHPDRAVDFLRLLARDFPDDPDVLYYSTQVYSDLSTRASQRLLVSAPGSYQAHQLNAEVLELEGKLEDAAAEYRKVLSLNPRLPGIHYRLGRLLLAGSREAKALAEARREFEEELRVDPSSAGPEYELGEMARQARQWNEAIEHFSRAVKMEPRFAEALIGLGKSLVSAGRAAEAVAPLEAAVKLEPQNPVAHYQLSFAYRRVGSAKEAEKELAAYRQAYGQALETRQKIRAGILGRMTQEQTAEPPE